MRTPVIHAPKSIAIPATPVIPVPKSKATPAIPVILVLGKVVNQIK
jgi:hypothetical protein